MLFVFDRPAVHRFTMTGTPLPLDMLFLDSDGVVVGIAPNTTPFSPKLRGTALPSQYVLEVNAGWAQFYGVVPGDQFTYTAF